MASSCFIASSKVGLFSVLSVIALLRLFRILSFKRNAQPVQEADRLRAAKRRRPLIWLAVTSIW